jgi:hypothetical protein
MDIPLLWYLVFLGHGFIIEGKNEHSGIKTRSFNTTQPLNMTVKVKKVKQSLYTPWRRLGGEEV